LQVGQKTALGFVVGVRNIVANHRAFAGHEAEFGHGELLK
jgi:hypothetical protein